MGCDNSNGNDGVTKRILERKKATAVSTKYETDYPFRREVFLLRLPHANCANHLIGLKIFHLTTNKKW